MVEAVLNIKQWGNNLSVRLPAAVVRWCGRRICMSISACAYRSKDQVVITPVDDSRFTQEQRLAAYDAKRHGGEQIIQIG
jgi:antitoxin MazE